MNIRHAISVVLVIAFQAGCDQSQTVESCTDNIAEKTSKPSDDNGSAIAVGDGGPCDINEDCVNGACIASQNSFSYGYCYGQDMTGCIVVTDPSPFKEQCPSPTKRLYVCGDGEDVTQWGANCASIGVGQFGETYECCDAP